MYRIRRKIKALEANFVVFFYNFFTRKRQLKNLATEIKQNTPRQDYSFKNSNICRSVEVHEFDKNLKEVLFSCYFINKADPQTGETQGKAKFDYIKVWYESVKNLDINAVIIHDGIDNDFIAEYQTSKIRFRRFYSGNHPLIDERWIAYYSFLLKTSVEKAFFTDIGDVAVTKFPFGIISNKNQFFIGRDKANKIRLSGWILNEIETYKMETGIRLPKSFFHQPLYNVGIVGGNRKVMLFVLARFIEFVLKSDTNTYKEMTIFNYIVHTYFFPLLTYSLSDKVLVDPSNDISASHSFLISGYPLNSAFKRYELDSDAIFIHK